MATELPTGWGAWGKPKRHSEMVDNRHAGCFDQDRYDLDEQGDITLLLTNCAPISNEEKSGSMNSTPRESGTVPSDGRRSPPGLEDPQEEEATFVSL